MNAEELLTQWLGTEEGWNEFSDMLEESNKLVISDLRCKAVKELVDRGGPYSDDEVYFFGQMAGPMNGHSFNEDDWEDEGLADKYAEHIRNYLYTYKDSATKIDPSIDPEEEHIGPMAQDIEQVAPDCVKETEEGVKVVDGNRLALVNAGVIADLARRLNDLEAKVYDR